MEASPEIIRESQSGKDSSRIYVGGRKPMKSINADNVALFQKPWTNLDQRKKEVATLNSLHMVNDRRNGWLEAMAKSVDNSFASANISLSTPDHGHIVQGRLRNGWKPNASGVEEAALHDIQFRPATPGEHAKPFSDGGCPADRQWSLSASAADTVEANNSPPSIASGGVSAPLSREASPPCEGMMTPPMCQTIAGLAESTPRYTPRYSPRMTARQRATPGEKLFLDGVDEARESSPIGECEGYFSKLQVHDSSLALTPTPAETASDEYSSPLRPAGKGKLLCRSSPPPGVVVSAVVENAWQVVNAESSVPNPSKLPVSPASLEVRMYNSPGVDNRKDARRAQLGGSEYMPSPTPSPGAPDGLDDTSIHSEGEGYYYIPEDDPMGQECTWMPSPPPAPAPNSWWGIETAGDSSAGGGEWPPINGSGLHALTPPGQARGIPGPKFSKLSAASADVGTAAMVVPPAPNAEPKTPVMCGVGVKLMKHGPSGAIIIADIARSGPADKTGLISVGDQIVQINNEPVGGMDVRRAQEMLRGLPGTTVMISMWHGASAKSRADEGMLINAVVVREQFVYSEQALA